MLFSIVNKEMGKKSTFVTIKTIFAAAFFLQILLKVGTLVKTQHLFIAISLVKLNHSHRKYSRTKFYRRIFLKCQAHGVTHGTIKHLPQEQIQNLPTGQYSI